MQSIVAMGPAILIALVMYFFLLPSRYAGERYAPTLTERYIVVVMAGLVALALYAASVGPSVRFRFADISFFVAIGLFVVYFTTVPFRALLGFPFPKIEKTLLVIGMLAIVGLLVMYPLFGWA